MTTNLLNRYRHAEIAMLLATLPTCGVVECDLPDITTRVSPQLLTGPGWRESQRKKLERGN